MLRRNKMKAQRFIQGVCKQNYVTVNYQLTLLNKVIWCEHKNRKRAGADFFSFLTIIKMKSCYCQSSQDKERSLSPRALRCRG